MNSALMRLTLRDIRKVLGLRTLLVWGPLSALGVFFLYATGGKTALVQKGEVVFMALFLPQIIFGAWAILSIYFDLVSTDREHSVLDCILCAGVAKSLVFWGKMIALGVTALALSLAYLLPVTAAIVALSGNMAHGRLLLQYLLPLWGYIMVHAALGITISVLARSTKAALIASLAAGLFLMPRFFILIVEGIGTALRWTQATKDAVSLIAPGAMMYALAQYAGTAVYMKTAIIFSSSIIAFLVVSHIAFCRQDELNYGE